MDFNGNNKSDKETSKFHRILGTNIKDQDRYGRSNQSMLL
jgi:hypothetical protein